MKFLKETEDIRGKIIWLSSDEDEIHIVETKKGFARGGHYHPFDSTHVVISGSIIYKAYDPKTANEEDKVIEPTSVVLTPAGIAHIMIAIEDSIFIEMFHHPYEAVTFAPYRQIVEEKMKI